MPLCLCSFRASGDMLRLLGVLPRAFVVGKVETVWKKISFGKEIKFGVFSLNSSIAVTLSHGTTSALYWRL